MLLGLEGVVYRGVYRPNRPQALDLRFRRGEPVDLYRLEVMRSANALAAAAPMPGSNVLGMIAKGDVTTSDYTDTLDPAIDEALENHDEIRLLYVLGADFTGYSGGAMWEDAKLGAKALKFEMIAVVTDNEWIRHTVDAMGWLIPAKVKTFHVSEEADASEWITS